MLKRTPLYNNHVKLNAKMVPFAGWEMPVSYKGIIEEHNAVRKSSGLFDIGHMGLIKIKNSSFAAAQLRRMDKKSKIKNNEPLNFIQYITTNDVAKLEENRCQYSILCNEAGGTVDDILVYRLADRYMIVCNACNTDKVVGWLASRLRPRQGVLVELEEQRAILSVQGPQAEKIVGGALNIDLSTLKRNRTLWHKNILVSRTGYTGEDGLELIAGKDKVVSLWQTFIKEGVQPCGLGARDTLRLEAGLPLYGHEYDQETSPLEAGYGWAVKFGKGDFIGRKALLQQKEKGVTKKLMGLEVEGKSIPRAGDLVSCGKVTSGTFSPTFKKPIALAYLAAKEAVPGNTVQVEIRGRKIPAKVVAKTFYKR